MHSDIFRALALVATERARQIDKGYDADHDDAHVDQELALACAWFDERARLVRDPENGMLWAWPFPGESPDVSNDTEVELLTKAAGMAQAEYQRLIRRIARELQAEERGQR